MLVLQITSELLAAGINFKDPASAVNTHRGLSLHFFAPNLENDKLKLPNIKEVTANSGRQVNQMLMLFL